MERMPELKRFGKRYSGSEKGFTLIELLIVIAIIGILAAIAIPQFNQYKSRAYDADAKANLHNIYLACKAYWLDHGPTLACTSASPGYVDTSYGYIQSTDVVVSGSGDEYVFAATAQNTNSTNTYSLNANGVIS